MTDFVPDSRDRLEVPICKAIEAKDYKQALKLVEKRLAKGSDSYLQALRCFILCSHNIVTERGKGLREIFGLSDTPGREHAAVELDIYDEAAKALFPRLPSQVSAAICKLRIEAVKASPRDEKLAVACFRACLKVDNLECAQLIAVSLEKNFPSNHAYPFWAITTAALLAISPACPKQKVQILSMLAYQKIKILASVTVKDTVEVQSAQLWTWLTSPHEKTVNPIRSIQTPQELLLFHRLLAAQGNDEDGLKICRDEVLRPTSKIAKGEWIFRRNELQLMELRKEWRELFETSYTLLSASRPKNEDNMEYDARGADWAVWKAFIRAVSELKSAQAISVATKELEAHLDENSDLDKTYRRNASLAMIEFQFATSPAISPEETGNHDLKSANDYDLRRAPRVLALWQHLWRYGHTASAFGDIKDSVEKLSFEELQFFAIGFPRFLNHSTIYLALGKWKNEEAKKSNKGLIMTREVNGKSPPPPHICDWDELVSGVTNSKLEYLIKSSLAEKTRSSLLGHCDIKISVCDWCHKDCEVICTNCLRKIAKDSLRSYSWGVEDNAHIKEVLKPTDKHPADEWAILAATCLMKAAGCRPLKLPGNSRHTPNLVVQELLRATVILEFAHSHSKANPQISLLLIRLYSCLGAGSLAMRAYNQLGLKQVQGDTLSYTLFDRISSLHPHQVVDSSDGSSHVLNPSLQLKRLQKLYRGFKDHVITNSWRSFENGNYDSIFQLMDVSDKLSRSMGLAMSVVELRKIDRLTNPAAVLDRNSHGYDVLRPNPFEVEYSDNADYSSFPNYEHSMDPPFETYTRVAPGPSQERTRAFLLIEELWLLTSNISETKVKQAAALVRLQHLTETVSIVRRNVVSSECFTDFERRSVEICTLLISIIQNVTDPAIMNLDQIPRHVNGICQAARRNIGYLKSDLNKFIGEERKSNWFPMFVNTLHPLYTAYEAASLTVAAINYILTTELWTMPGIKDHVLRLEEDARGLKKFIIGKGVTVRKWVNEGQWLDRVVNSVTSEVPGVLDQSSTESNESMKNNSQGIGKSVAEEDQDGLGKEEADHQSQAYMKRKRIRDIKETEKKVNTPSSYSLHSKDFPAFATQNMGALVSEAIPEEFLEYWAGQLVDSWRESVMGLACLKPL